MPGPITLMNNPSAQLRQLLPAVERELIELQTIAGNTLADLARSLSPVRTGYLRSTIAVRSLEGGLSFMVEVTAPYAFWVHFGTATMPPRPFMNWAVDRFTPWYLNEVNGLMARALKRAGLS